MEIPLFLIALTVRILVFAFAIDPLCGFPWRLAWSIFLTIDQVHKYQEKDRHGQISITKYRNVNFISDHQTCHVFEHVLSK